MVIKTAGRSYRVRRVDLGPRACGDRDVGTRRREDLGDAEADALAAAGDEHALSLQCEHDPPANRQWAVGEPTGSAATRNQEGSVR